MSSAFYSFRYPEKDQLVATVTKILGFGKFKASNKDGKEYFCSVPDNLLIKINLKEGDVVIIRPWNIDAEKADFVWVYRLAHHDHLRKHGFIN